MVLVGVEVGVGEGTIVTLISQEGAGVCVGVGVRLDVLDGVVVFVGVLVYVGV